MKRLGWLFIVLLILTPPLFAANQSLAELFKLAKDKFAAGDFKSSLEYFDVLNAESAKPGFESDRAKLIPVVTFYRGANLSALGKKAEAKEAFIAYLGFTPNAAITSPPFPKATVDLFEQARDQAGKTSQTVAVAYSTFATPPTWTLPPDERWIETPVRYLLTPAQRKEYATFTSNAERATFIEAFWRQLDPTPTTDVNEFRIEFERRLAFCDLQFPTPKLPGRETERAATFALLGPPTYVATSKIAADSMSQLRAQGNSKGLAGITNPLTNPVPSMPGGKGPIHNPIYSEIWESDRPKEDNLETDTRRGGRETWYYRSERLPKTVPYKEVRFEFITKEGYGTSVFQKDSEPVQALGIAADEARRDKKLN